MAAPSLFLYEPEDGPWTANATDSDISRPRFPDIDTFNLMKPLKKKFANVSTERFRSYHRLSGAFSTDQQMLIDFDLNHFSWRIMAPANATNGRTETLIRNGTWMNTTSSCPHAFFPEFQLQASNFHFFSKRCHYQPFMTFFRVDGISYSEVLERSERDWSSKSEDNVVMRTANFGHGQHALVVLCEEERLQPMGERSPVRDKRRLA